MGGLAGRAVPWRSTSPTVAFGRRRYDIFIDWWPLPSAFCVSWLAVGCFTLFPRWAPRGLNGWWWWYRIHDQRDFAKCKLGVALGMDWSSRTVPSPASANHCEVGRQQRSESRSRCRWCRCRCSSRAPLLRPAGCRTGRVDLSLFSVSLDGWMPTSGQLSPLGAQPPWMGK